MSESEGRGPQLFPIQALHRHDGYIAFALESDDFFRPSFSIRADALDTMFPEFRSRLLKDSFVSINSSYCLANRETKALYGTPRHKIDTLRYLCACYCDIDFYKINPQRTFNEALKYITTLCEAGELPWASVVVNSGHGMWLMWLLHDANDPTKAHYGTWNNNPNDHYQLYSKINHAIGKRLAQLGADAAARDGARYCRVPGTFRTDREKEVRWTIHGKGNLPYSYTLKELASFFAIAPVVVRSTQEREALGEVEKKCGNRSKAWKAAARNTLAAFVTLKDGRGGGFDEGCRNRAAMLYATLLHRNGESRADAHRAVLEMAAQCRRPLSKSECESAIKNVYKHKRGKFKTNYHHMADTFDVSPHEAEIISQAIGKPFPPASRFGEWKPATTQSGREKKQANRQQEIRTIVRDIEVLGATPSYRAMKGLLFARGIDASHVTIKADYKALGIISSGTANLSRISAARSQQPDLALSAAC